MPSTVTKNLISKIFFDLILTLSALIPYFVLNFAIQPFHRGFFCDDESIRYPAKSSTISSACLYLVSILSVFFIIVITEYHRLPPMIRGTKSLQSYLFALYHQIIIFAFGGMTLVSLTSIAKYSVGRLRPNFIAVCQPNNVCLTKLSEYIEEYQCNNEDKDSRLSFFSGHASWSAYSAVYISMYLNTRIRLPRMVLLKSLIQSIAAYLAFYTGLSRISDYKHHPSDVAVGFAVGTLIAYLTVTWIADHFKLTTWGSLIQGRTQEDNSLLRDHRGSTYSTIEPGE